MTDFQGNFPWQKVARGQMRPPCSGLSLPIAGRKAAVCHHDKGIYVTIYDVTGGRDPTRTRFMISPEPDETA